MIFTDRKITIRNGKSTIDEPVVLYRGDFEVSIKFTIMESKFRFKSGVNLVDSEKASYGQLAILTPYCGNVFSEVVKCEDGTVTFTLTKEMIDQLEEVGLYSFQIRLFDYYRESRVSIPPVEFGIEVREPVASEDHDNEVNNAIVGYSIARCPISKVADGLNENVPDTFDDNGNYNKTDWETGDRISEGKLNKIEDAIDKINQNEKNDKQALGKQMTSNYLVLDNKIEEVATKGTTSAVVEGTTKSVINKMISDGTMGSLTVAHKSIDTLKLSPMITQLLTNGKVTFNDPNLFLKYTGANNPSKKTWEEKVEANVKRHKLIEMIPTAPDSYIEISIAEGYEWSALYFEDIDNCVTDGGWTSGSRVITIVDIKYIGLSIRKADNSEFANDDEIIEANLTVELIDIKAYERYLQTNYNNNAFVDMSSITFDEGRGGYSIDAYRKGWYEDGDYQKGRIRIHDPFYIEYGESLYLNFNDNLYDATFYTYTIPTNHATSKKYTPDKWFTKSPLVIPNNNNDKKPIQIGVVFRDKFMPSGDDNFDTVKFYNHADLKIIIKPAINTLYEEIYNANDDIEDMEFKYKCHTSGVTLADLKCVRNVGAYKHNGYWEKDIEAPQPKRVKGMRAIFVPKGYQLRVLCPDTSRYQYTTRVYDYDNLPDTVSPDPGWLTLNEYIVEHDYSGNILVGMSFRNTENIEIDFDDFITNFDIHFKVEPKGSEAQEVNTYESEQLAKIIDKIQNKERYDFIAPFITDTHAVKSKYPNNNIDHMKTVVKLTEQSLIDCVLHGGDVCWDYFDISTFNSYMREASNVLHQSKCSVLVAPGNHDIAEHYHKSAADRSVVWNYEQFSKVMNGNKGIVHGPDGACYKDFQEQKLRILVVNCHDAYVLDADGDPKYNTSEGGDVVYAIRQKQMEFLRDALICEDGWNIFIMSHASLLDGVLSNLKQPTNAPIFLDILAARKNNTAVSKNEGSGDFAINIECDYTNCGTVNIIGCAYGHTHYDSMYTRDGITHIGVTNSSGNHNNLLANKSNACTFDVLCMNFEERRVDVFRYGTTTGSDRNFTF